MGALFYLNVLLQMAINFYLYTFGCTGSLLLDSGFSLRQPCLLQSTVSRCAGSVAGALRLVAPQHEESSRIRDQTHVPCNSRWILIHCTTREAQFYLTFHCKHCPQFYERKKDRYLHLCLNPVPST